MMYLVWCIHHNINPFERRCLLVRHSKIFAIGTASVCVFNGNVIQFTYYNCAHIQYIQTCDSMCACSERSSRFAYTCALCTLTHQLSYRGMLSNGSLFWQAIIEIIQKYLDVIGIVNINQLCIEKTITKAVQQCYTNTHSCDNCGANRLFYFVAKIVSINEPIVLCSAFSFYAIF